MKKGLKRAGICLLVMLSIRCGAFLAGISEPEPGDRCRSTGDFYRAVERVWDWKPAGEYIRKTIPKLKELASLAEEEMKNMFPEE